jgi:hypothetical protein
MYDMATDSAGHIHLLVVGHLSAERDNQKPPGLYHFEWDGEDWSSPTPVYEESWYPEYPHLVIHRGNQLHATWFIRQDVFNAIEPHQIWYAHGQSSAPAETPVARPTSEPVSQSEVVETPTPSPAPTSVPTSTLDPDLAQLSVPAEATDSIYTETDELLLLLKSLAPAALIVVVIVIGVRALRRRK